MATGPACFARNPVAAYRDNSGYAGWKFSCNFFLPSWLGKAEKPNMPMKLLHNRFASSSANVSKRNSTYFLKVSGFRVRFVVYLVLYTRCRHIQALYKVLD